MQAAVVTKALPRLLLTAVTVISLMGSIAHACRTVRFENLGFRGASKFRSVPWTTRLCHG